MSKNLKILLVSLLLLSSGCYAKEMYVTDPTINFEERNVKKVLFIGFITAKEVKIPEKVRENLNLSLAKALESVNQIEIVKPSNDDIVNKDLTNQNEIVSLVTKYNTDLVVAGTIKDFNEIKYLEQQPQNMYVDTMSSTNNTTTTLKNFVRFQSVLLGSINFFTTNGKSIWSENIDSIENIQLESLASTVIGENDPIITSIREKLVTGITSKIMRNLLPYYSYK